LPPFSCLATLLLPCRPSLSLPSFHRREGKGRQGKARTGA
jgi:hypothetical protein